MRLIVCLGLVLVLLSGCISIGSDAQLTRWANQEWKRVHPPERFKHVPITGKLCIGSPGVMGHAFGLDTFVPWPWNHCEFMSRVIMRYELSKAAYQMHGWESTGPLLPVAGPIMWLDALFHLPPSELHSWYRVFFPGELKD